MKAGGLWALWGVLVFVLGIGVSGCSGPSDFERVKVLGSGYELGEKCQNVSKDTLNDQREETIEACCRSCAKVGITALKRIIDYRVNAKKKRLGLALGGGTLLALAGISLLRFCIFRPGGNPNLRPTRRFWPLAWATAFILSTVAWFGTEAWLARDLPKLWSADWMLRQVQDAQLHQPGLDANLSCHEALTSSKGQTRSTCAEAMLKEFQGFPPDEKVAQGQGADADSSKSKLDVVNRRFDQLVALFGLGNALATPAKARTEPTTECSWFAACNESRVYAEIPYLGIAAGLLSGFRSSIAIPLSCFFAVFLLRALTRLRRKVRVMSFAGRMGGSGEVVETANG
jgi:hypothetical protein